jgi:stage II sporulation protein D
MPLPSAPRVSHFVASLAALAQVAGCAAEEVVAPSPLRPTAPLAAVVAPPGHIRIGVLPEREEVFIGATGNYRVLDDATGAELLTGSADETSVRVKSKSVQVTFWRVQVQCTGSQTFAADWVLRVESFGYDPFTEFVPAARCWRLRVGRFPTRNAALAAQPTLFQLGLAPAASGGLAFQVTIFEGVTVYEATRGDATVETANPVRVAPGTDGVLTIGGAPYRGVGEVRLNGLGSLAAINELPIEDYLLGVVPRELGPIAFPYLEALKAQAVAARTYAHANLGKRRNDGYDLLPTVSDQVYGGISAEHPLSSQAVEQTAGVVGLHNGKLISALYSSTSGGWTANSEDVFTAAEPYLRGVPDKERGNALNHVPTLEVFRSHANPTSLRAAREGDFESDWSSRHRWYVSWTPDEMRTVLSTYFNTEVGRVLAVNVVGRSSSGRALRVDFVTENGTYSETKDRIRSALKFFNAAGVQTSLNSTLFFIEPVTDSRTKQLTGFEAWGGGWGHGVGMSQTGAVGMAQRGDTYDQILKHYYRGITLEAR